MSNLSDLGLGDGFLNKIPHFEGTKRKIELYQNTNKIQDTKITSKHVKLLSTIL